METDSEKQELKRRIEELEKKQKKQKKSFSKKVITGILVGAGSALAPSILLKD